MRSLKRRVTLVGFILGAMLSTVALAQTAQKQGTGVITGRVTSGDKGIANISVQLFPIERASDRSAVAKATTDYQGNYKMTNVPAGHYSILAVAPAMVGQSDTPYGTLDKSITISEGETVEKMDFALVRGGVITGRVTDADGAPVIGERVQLSQPNAQGRSPRSYSFFNPYMYQTDDRGIYRIYGIPPGNYTVSIGESKNSGEIRFGFGGRGYYSLTYYPSVTDQSKATVIEVMEGSEASNIDITLGRKEKSYAATGRVVDESGQPVPNIRIAAAALMKDDRMGGFGGGMPTDAQGRFRIDGLLPGRYATSVWNMENSNESYSDPIKFEIVESDISGLEIKLHRGASISGVAIIEGTTDRSILAKLNQFTVNAMPITDREQGTLAYINSANTKIAPDGTFKITGVRPGKFNLNVWAYPATPGLSLARIEHDGVAQREFEITSGAQVTGIRIVFAYGSGSIRGLVKTDSDALPDVRRMMVTARPVTQGVTLQIQPVQVDTRGHFLIEGIPTGEYEVTLQVYSNPVGQPRPVRPVQVKQRVSVTNGIESEVTLTFNLNTTQPEGSNNE
jgi:protocatechuate 3,4-dioxygenase beta subunit